MIFSDAVIISDPCYDFSKNLALTVQILVGEYQAIVYIHQGKIAEVQIINKDYENENLYWDKIGEISVDAGEVGIFDYSLKDLLGVKENNQASKDFYDKCGDYTCNANGYGEEENFFISKTGFGDGIYPVYVSRNNNGEVYAINIRYMEAK